MQIDLVAFYSFLPQFAAAGIVSIYFYSTFRKTHFEHSIAKKFLIGESSEPWGDGSGSDKETDQGNEETQLTALDRIMADYVSNDGKKDTEDEGELLLPHSKYRTPFVKPERVSYGILGDTQVILLSLDLWILVSLLLSPINRISALLPTFPTGYSYIIYTILGAAIAIAILTTVVSRIKVTRNTLTIMIIAAGAITFGLFYAPSMAWLNGMNGIIRIVILYSAVVLVCMAVYAISTFIHRRKAFRASAYASFASYGITSFLLFFNLFTLMFS